MSGGQENALQAAKALQVPIPLIHQWQDFRRMALAVPSTSSRPLRQGTTEAVEAIIGHRFRLPHLLAQALVNDLILKRSFAWTLIQYFQTHASVDGYDATCYERLEFLGDAILDFRMSPTRRRQLGTELTWLVTVQYIFRREDHLSPGAMTMLKVGSARCDCSKSSDLW